MIDMTSGLLLDTGVAELSHLARLPAVLENVSLRAGLGAAI